VIRHLNRSLFLGAPREKVKDILEKNHLNEIIEIRVLSSQKIRVDNKLIPNKHFIFIPLQFFGAYNNQAHLPLRRVAE